MADPIARPDPNHRSQNDERRLNYAFDGGFVSGALPSDTPDDEDSAVRLSSESESDSERSESDELAVLAASLRVFSESMLKTELVELEMVKAREAARLAAEKRQAELDADLTQMVMQTQLQIASCVARISSNRKRKRSNGEDDSSTPER